MIRLEMKNCNMILTKKLQKISAISSVKINKYEYLTGEEILPPDHSRMIELNFPKRKRKENQLKSIENTY